MDRVQRCVGHGRCSLNGRHARELPGRAGQFSRDMARRFALQLWLVERGVQDALADSPVEVVLTVEPAMDAGSDAERSRRWSRQIFAVYAAWAERRHMQVLQREFPGGVPALVVAGFGAATELAREIGLHVLESDDARRCVAECALRHCGLPPMRWTSRWRNCKRHWGRRREQRNRPALSLRALAAGARHRTRLAHGQARRRPARRLRPDRGHSFAAFAVLRQRRFAPEHDGRLPPAAQCYR